MQSHYHNKELDEMFHHWIKEIFLLTRYYTLQQLPCYHGFLVLLVCEFPFYHGYLAYEITDFKIRILSAFRPQGFKRSGLWYS